jgi:cell division inhibitor SulA
MAGLSEAEMRPHPARGVNSIVWLLCHMAQTEDASVNLVVVDDRQVLDNDWVRRVGVPWRHIGTGMTDDKVSQVSAKADLAAVRAYRDAVGRRTREEVRALAPAAREERVEIADTARADAAGALGPNVGLGGRRRVPPLAGTVSGGPARRRRAPSQRAPPRRGSHHPRPGRPQRGPVTRSDKVIA